MSVCLKCLSAKKGQFHTAILVEVKVKVEVEVEVEVEVVVVVVVVVEVVVVVVVEVVVVVVEEDLYMTFKTILWVVFSPQNRHNYLGLIQPHQLWFNWDKTTSDKWSYRAPLNGRK